MYSRQYPENLTFRTMALVRRRGGFGPAERFWIGIGDVDVGFDGCFEFGNRTEHAAPENARCEKREEAFDLVDP